MSHGYVACDCVNSDPFVGKDTIIFVIRACLIHDSELAYGSVWCDDRHGFAHTWSLLVNVTTMTRTSLSAPAPLVGKDGGGGGSLFLACEN